MLGILATEAGGHLDLIGEIRGYAIVFFSVGLFCGSIYLLLATDVGSRLGFLISFASLTGFLAMLGLIWFTNLTPLNALHGPPPHWEVTEIVDNPAQAKNEKVRTIEEDGVPLDAAAQGEIKATVDSAVTAAEGEFHAVQVGQRLRRDRGREGRRRQPGLLPASAAARHHEDPGGEEGRAAARRRAAAPGGRPRPSPPSSSSSSGISVPCASRRW